MNDESHQQGTVPVAASPFSQQQGGFDNDVQEECDNGGDDEPLFDFAAMQSEIASLMQRVRDNEQKTAEARGLPRHAPRENDGHGSTPLSAGAISEHNQSPLQFHGRIEPQTSASLKENSATELGTFKVTSSPPSVTILPSFARAWESLPRSANAQSSSASLSASSGNPQIGEHVLVANLERRTTENDLYKIFFPMGATGAALHSGAPSARKSGLVAFSSSRAAQIAAEKLNNFVPHGQSQPLSVVWLPLAGTLLPSQNNIPSSQAIPYHQPAEQNRSSDPGESSVPPGFQQAEPPTTADIMPHAAAVSSSTVSGVSASIGAVLLENALRQSDLSGQAVARFLLSNSDREDMIEVLLRTLRDDQQRGISLFSSLLSHLDRTATEKAQLQDALCRSLVKCFLEPSTDKTERTGSAIVTGYLFDYHFIAGTPFAMARRLIQTRAHTDSTLVDALVSLTSSWSLRHPNRHIIDPDEETFKAEVHKFYSMHATSGGSSFGPDSSVELTPSVHRSSAPSTPAPPPRIAPGQYQRTPPSCGPSLSSEEGYMTEMEILASTVYVAHVAPTVSESRLRALFVECGDINKVRLYDNPRRPGSFGFVEFATPSGARTMLETMDKLDLDGMSLRCSPARSVIHDHDSRDAISSPAGRVRGCLFGLTAKPRNVPSRR